ncbi:hypothetical protein [Gilvimarinus chinensis]|uniref:hypothetical protein n=1 Tax=Gilvimarinus chinensis TaxID=396005 RepID=UPI00037A7D95|nr:hypothetical protein [Gilvimarinus chinensis]
MILSVEQGDVIEAVRAIVGYTGAVYSVAVRAKVECKVPGGFIHVDIPPQDGGGYGTTLVQKYQNLDAGDWCCAALVDLPGEPRPIWVAAPIPVKEAA